MASASVANPISSVRMVDPKASLAMSINISGGGAAAGNRMTAHRGTVTALKKRDKRRGKLLAVLAIARMRVLMRPRLDNRERLLLFRLFLSAGVMRTIQTVMEVLASAGIGGGHEEIEEFLVKNAWFKPGMVVEWQQFLMLAKYFKGKFVKAQEVSDSDVAFIALGGNEDLTGNVSADVLRKVWKDFDLREDIETFIETHDEDKSGELEIDEFSALFEEKQEEGGKGGHGHGNGANGDGGTAVANVMRLDDDDDVIAARRRREEEKEAERLHKQREREEALKEAEQHEANPQQIMAEVDQFIREQNATRDGGPRKEKKARPTQKDPKSPGAAGRKPLWEPAKPAEMPAKERLAVRAAAVQPGSTFTSSRRFDFVDSVSAPGKSPENADGSKSARLPPISPRSAADPKAPQPWYARNPFDTGNNASSPGGGGGGGGQASPRNGGTDGAATARRRDPKQYERQKLPVVVRNSKGQSVLVQPEMTF